jgi:hypothetical protein
MNNEEIEKKLSEFAETIQRQFDEMKKHIDERLSKIEAISEPPKITVPKVKKRCDSAFWGVVLLVVGIILLGNYFRWFYLDIPIFPSILVILGAYLILEDRLK